MMEVDDEKAKALLLEMRERLKEKIESRQKTRERLDKERSFLDGDAITTSEPGTLFALNRNSEEILRQVEAALCRLDAGAYGICEECGEKINPERLEAISYTTLCISCREKRERSRRF